MKSICSIKKMCGAFAVSAVLVLCGCGSDGSEPVNAAGIEVSSVPRKMSYKKGEKLSLSGLEVKMNMTDGSARTLSAEEYTAAPDDGAVMNDEGAVPVKITSDGKTVYFVVYVGNAETAVGIEISSLPDKTNYKKGESLDLTGLAVKMNRTDGSSVELTDYTAEPAAGTPLEEDGIVPVKITSGGKTVFFTVSVGKVELKRLLLTALPTKTYYLSGEAFKTDGLSVTVQFDDGTERELGYGEYHISILNGDELKDGFGQEVTVSYGNLSAYFIINVSSGYEEVTIGDDEDKIERNTDGVIYKIKNSAYNSAEKLRKVTIPDTITEIGAQAFYNCTALEEITLPASVQTIDTRAFYGCKSLRKIVIPHECNIGESAFENCIGVTELTFEDSWSGGSKAFANLTNLVTLDLGTPLNLGDAFQGCTSLTSVTIPDSVTSINGAFQGCTSLTSVTIPNRVTSMNSAFQGCTSLTSIEIPNSVTDINSAFSGCTSLTSITIPNSVTSIWRAFQGCTSLTSIEIPNSVTGIGSAFSGCTSLTSVTIPNSVTDINSAFSGCTSLTSVTIPNSVTSMDDAFSGCTSLTSIEIPDSVTSMLSAFSGCTSLTSIEIPNSVTNMYYAFYGCTSLTSVTISNGVTDMGGAFKGCISLTNIEIPDGVTNIRDAFYDCTKLESVTIPNSVTNIINAFWNCKNLTKITYKGTIRDFRSIDEQDWPGLDGKTIRCTDGEFVY